MKLEPVAALECTGQLGLQRTASVAAAGTVEERWRFEKNSVVAVDTVASLAGPFPLRN